MTNRCYARTNIFLTIKVSDCSGNPNLPDKHLCNTAVHYAAQEGHPTCLRLLIEAGGDYSITNFDGYTALDLATRACERVIEKKRKFCKTQLIRGY